MELCFTGKELFCLAYLHKIKTQKTVMFLLFDVEQIIISVFFLKRHMSESLNAHSVVIVFSVTQTGAKK